MTAGDLQRRLDQRPTGWWADSKPRISRPGAAVAGAGHAPPPSASSRRQLRGVQARLGDLRPPRGRPRSRRTRPPPDGLELGPRAHPHPGLGDRRRGCPRSRAASGPARGPRPSPAADGSPRCPDGVIARTDSTRSSMWVCRVAKWPPARVAIQPPRVENSKDCGKWRRVSPCARSCVLQPGPVAPAWIARRPATGVDLEHPVQPPQVERHGGRSPKRGSTPPTTLVPPPNGITAAPLGLGPTPAPFTTPARGPA